MPPIYVDFEQWTRVLRNLIENALLYSPADSEVRVAAADVGDRMEIWVEDCGPGVPPEERERIFEKFYRGEAHDRPGALRHRASAWLSRARS